MLIKCEVHDPDTTDHTLKPRVVVLDMITANSQKVQAATTA